MKDQENLENKVIIGHGNDPKIQIVKSSYKKGNVSEIGIAINLFKSFVGIGILALPHTF